MADGRSKNGAKKGENRGQGRKPKDEEQKVIEKLHPLNPKVFTALNAAITKGDRWAVELWFKYVVGMPRQSVDHTTNGDSITDIPLINWVSNKDKGINFMDNFDIDE